MTQKITAATLRVDTDAFWNWLADECDIDLFGMRLVMSEEPEGDTAVLFHIAADLTPLEKDQAAARLRVPLSDRGRSDA